MGKCLKMLLCCPMVEFCALQSLYSRNRGIGATGGDQPIQEENDPRRGVLLALAGFALLSCGDAVIKTMAGQWSPLAIAALRFTIGAAGLAAILRVRQGAAAFRPAKLWLQMGRGFCMAMATLGFFTAIFFMPLAEATAMVFLAPILTALLSGPLLGERVHRSTWIVSIIAFAGVIIVLRPNLAAVGWIALLPVMSACFFSLMLIANRAVARQGSPLSMQVFVAGFAAPVLILAALIGSISGAEVFHIGWPDWTVLARCTFVALTASTAHYMVYLGTMRAGASTIAPTTYVQLLVAVLLGWAVFGDRPDIMTLAGALVIVAAGLYLWRDGKQRVRYGQTPTAER